MLRSALLLLLFPLMLVGACSDSDTDSDATPPPTEEPSPDMEEMEEPEEDANNTDTDEEPSAPLTIRVATFNTSLFRTSDGALRSALEGGQDDHAKAIANIIQFVRPDIVLLNEFDWDANGESARIFEESYLAVGQGSREPIRYPHHYVPTSNTGVLSGVDLNQDGNVAAAIGDQGYGNDSYGFGLFPGQYGMVVYSTLPIATDKIRTFQNLLWKDMPNNLLPADWYGEEATDVLRLSSKNHIDVPVEVNGTVLHVLASHPTPPSFDGDEDRNGKRNHDEIKFWSDYLSPAPTSDYIADDGGQQGGLASEEAFFILGDLNSDPVDADSRHEAIQNLLAHPRVQDTSPQSEGGALAGPRDGRANDDHQGSHALDTADFSDSRVGNIRVDYALPSSNLKVTDSGVFWPAPGVTGANLVGVSDHRMVWVDVEIE